MLRLVKNNTVARYTDASQFRADWIKCIKRLPPSHFIPFLAVKLPKRRRMKMINMKTGDTDHFVGSVGISQSRWLSSTKFQINFGVASAIHLTIESNGINIKVFCIIASARGSLRACGPKQYETNMRRIFAHISVMRRPFEEHAIKRNGASGV